MSRSGGPLGRAGARHAPERLTRGHHTQCTERDSTLAPVKPRLYLVSTATLFLVPCAWASISQAVLGEILAQWCPKTSQEEWSASIPRIFVSIRRKL